ncbi:MAG: serine/threonine-protein phosphatase [Pirellulales bacterium]|nr:serine/threonine-protein phosphatase [Pirellulales bacterium]
MTASNSWKNCLEYAAISDVGLRRANNQDSYAVFLAGTQQDFDERGHFFLVADGMGAHAAGELASKIAADVVPLTYHKLREKSPPDALLAAVLDANDQIHNRGSASPDFKGMGTTATALVLLAEGALLAHVGDSRAYRLRGDRIEQLTFDHSLVWELQAAGQNMDDPPPSYVPKNIITRSLGPNTLVQVDREGPFPLQAGDTFLLCSDGLSGQVQDAEIGAVLACLPPAEAAQSLVHIANLRGGPDNITMIVAKVLGPQIADDGEQSTPPNSSTARIRPVNPWIWTILGTSALAALGFFAMGQWAIALLALLAAVAAGITAAFQRQVPAEEGWAVSGKRLGNGPHVMRDCAPNEEFIDRLADMMLQLRDAAASEQWQVDWNRFNRHLSLAETARQAADFTASGREYLRAVSFLMEQLKRQKPSE